MKKILTSLHKQPLWIQILIQLLNEYALPLILSTIWTLWNSSSAATYKEILKDGLLNFFAIGWAFSQWNRVKKQIKTEKGITDVRTGINDLVEKLENKTNDLIGYATGGDSFCELKFSMSTSENIDMLIFTHHGKFPLTEISARLANLDEFDRPVPLIFSEILSGKNTYEIESSIPEHVQAVPPKVKIPVSINKPIRLNVFYTARNGSFMQCLRMKYQDGKWLEASRIFRDEKLIHEKIDAAFPRTSEGDVDWN
ncbi:hypothetical protein GJ700_27875 [Duganella sp. FT92W]|uniref:Uncharacterized protein n=1 Tax=Pseudoduganella rivuli TaxID=2666085 RepID=A0A7X2LWV2_9BURK|nr:hypothetical protein [Pseudoduganella rivuli]MRV75542.1 hypothetical protein [Pseudoduganella rivuli]